MGPRSRSLIIASFRSCLSQDRSRILRSYAIIAIFVILFTVVLILLALPGWIADTDGTSALLMLAPGLLLLGGIGIIAAIITPLWLAQRRTGNAGEMVSLERLYGGFGYALIASIYLALIISAPSEYIDEGSGRFATAIEWLNGLSWPIAVILPLVVIVLLVLVDQRVVQN